MSLQKPLLNIIAVLTKQPLVTALSFFFTGAICFLPFYQYQFNPDTVSYAGIAWSWISGDFEQAINSYWSPLYSWLLVPIIATGIPVLIGCKLINFISGAIILILLNKLFSLIIHSPPRLLGYLLFSASVLLQYGLAFSTPDVLSTCICIAFIYYLLQPGKSLQTGLAGVMAIFSKSYNLYVVIISLIIMVVLNRNHWKKYGTAGLIIVGAALAWCGIIFTKYQQFMFSDAASFNFFLSGPDYTNYPMLIPEDCASLSPLHLFSEWDDPSLFHIKQWRPYYSFEDIGFYLKNNLLKHLGKTPLLLLTGWFISLLYLKQIKKNDMLFPLYIITLLFTLGYFVILTEKRYLIFPLLVVIGIIFSVLRQNKWNTVLIICISLFSMVQFMAQRIQSIHTGKDVYTLSDHIKAGSNIAATTAAWNRAIGICLYKNTRLHHALHFSSVLLPCNNQISWFIAFKGEVPDSVVVAQSGELVLVKCGQR